MTMTENMSIRVFLADDHPLMRLGLRLSLEQIDGIEIVGEASDGYSAVGKIQNDPPDVAMLDFDMPGLSGVGAIRVLRKAFPAMTILILSSYSDDSYISQAMQAGADGYLLKGIGSEELSQLIKSFYSGKPVMSPYLVNLTAGHDDRQALGTKNTSQLLTRREKDVLQCIVDGKSSKEISTQLFVSPETVKSHLKNIYRKLEVKNRVEAAMIATRENLIP
jgi:DNA-binding NarL/FixJ family response regulator